MGAERQRGARRCFVRDVDNGALREERSFVHPASRLKLSRAGLAKLMGGELRIGLLIGLVLAMLAFPLIWTVFGHLHLAAAVALAPAGAGVVASVLGLLLSWLLARSDSDPACGSRPRQRSCRTSSAC